MRFFFTIRPSFIMIHIDYDSLKKKKRYTISRDFPRDNSQHSGARRSKQRSIRQKR